MKHVVENKELAKKIINMMGKSLSFNEEGVIELSTKDWKIVQELLKTKGSRLKSQAVEKV